MKFTKAVLLLSFLGFSYEALATCLPTAKKSQDVELYWKLAEGQEKGEELTDLCDIAINDIRPTQFVVGMIEVQRKVEELSELSSKKLNNYLKKKPEPVVIGPKGEFYIIDHHHLGRALYEMNIKSTKAIILESWLGEDEEVFWSYMISKNWTYLFENGVEKSYKEVKKLKNISQLKDDPYRTLAGQTRCKSEEKCKEGQWLKRPIPFIEFQWADHFRKTPAVVSALKQFGSSDFSKVTAAATEEIKRLNGRLPLK